MKDASDAILECKSWKSKLEDANAFGPYLLQVILLTRVHVWVRLNFIPEAIPGGECFGGRLQ